MKKWKVIRLITTIILVLNFIYLIIDAIHCMTLSYPQMMLGSEAHNWLQLFGADLFFFMVLFGLPLLVDIVLLIISIVKLKKKNLVKNEK